VVDTYAEKWAAEEATKRVSGVRAVAEDLTVKLLAHHVKSDAEIESASQAALNWNVFVPSTVIAKVHRGEVTLVGVVTWNGSVGFTGQSPCMA
jgi:putative heme degradation protein